jgi:glycosyltransferase involved in cell wall biosynthesis
MHTLVLVGTYPPRRCGIATFTAALHASLVSAASDLNCAVFALSGYDDAHHYPAEVSRVIRQNVLADYIDAAQYINATNADVVCVQHEFGIFGGPAGRHLLTLLESVACPVVSTLHTVLEKPSDDERYVLDQLLTRSDKLIVMAERGRDVLEHVWGISPEKIDVIPHGAPNRPMVDNGVIKSKLGFANCDLLLTFGLLSPDKGIETMVRAMPTIIEARHRALYLILGVTHPNLLAQEGEHYRKSLQVLATTLGLGDAVRFVNSYLATPDFLDHIQAADICIMPYKKEAQITSGTLSTAAGLGKPIIATPFWHARDLLAHARGVLTPFGDAHAMSRAVIDLLSNPKRRQALQHRMFEASRELMWSRLGERYLEVFQECNRHGVGLRVDAFATVHRPPPIPCLKGVKRLTDDCGILQHSRLNVPDRKHGYCVDDNARALILMHRLPGPADEERKGLIATYASFVEHAWNDELGCFRNFMSYDRKWLEEKGSEDSFGRSFWAVAITVMHAREISHRRWAQSLLERVLPHIGKVSWPRSDAFLLIGLSQLCDAVRQIPAVKAIMTEKARRLAERLVPRHESNWLWFEDHLTYDNARLPEALIRAGYALGDEKLIECGLQSFGWLCRHQTSPNGYFRPVATADFGQFPSGGAILGQQPLEAAATIDACQAALIVDNHERWMAEAEKAYCWYFGFNDGRISLVEPQDGECCDGLTEAGLNLNLGAESVLAFQLATCALQLLREKAAARYKKTCQTGAED